MSLFPPTYLAWASIGKALPALCRCRSSLSFRSPSPPPTRTHTDTVAAFPIGFASDHIQCVQWRITSIGFPSDSDLQSPSSTRKNNVAVPNHQSGSGASVVSGSGSAYAPQTHCARCSPSPPSSFSLAILPYQLCDENVNGPTQRLGRASNVSVWHQCQVDRSSVLACQDTEQRKHPLASGLARYGRSGLAVGVGYLARLASA